MGAIRPLWSLLLAAAGFAIQPPGQFHGDEPVARDGQRWLALRVHGDAAALVATTLTVRAVHDPVLDGTGESTGLEVSSADGENVIAYLRGNGLKAGEVKRATIVPADADHSGLPYELVFRAQRYRIASDCGERPRDPGAEQLQFDCRIVLHAGDRSQVLSALTGYHEYQASTMSLGDAANPALLFAGDLDHDGELDLIFDATDHYNVSRPTLFLSSQAGSGELLREAARYESVGC